MGQATEVYAPRFDAVFFKLSESLRDRIESKIRLVGRNLGGYGHHRLKGANEYRLRVGDYRIIYQFTVQENVIELIALGHRREIYRNL